MNILYYIFYLIVVGIHHIKMRSNAPFCSVLSFTCFQVQYRMPAQVNIHYCANATAHNYALNMAISQDHCKSCC